MVTSQTCTSRTTWISPQKETRETYSPPPNACAGDESSQVTSVVCEGSHCVLEGRTLLGSKKPWFGIPQSVLQKLCHLR